MLKILKNIPSIIRINLDGSIPKDNPKFKDKKNWLPEIYQIGVRNPQGIALSPFDNKIYLSNHGAKGGDWFGTANYGENYGWKILGWEAQIIVEQKLVQSGSLDLLKPLNTGYRL